MQKLNELVPVNPGNIGGVMVSLVSAKKLHEFLGVGRDFTNWIKGRINQYGFAENTDYVVYANSGENPLGGRPTVDYLITIDMCSTGSRAKVKGRGMMYRLFIWVKSNWRNWNG